MYKLKAEKRLLLNPNSQNESVLLVGNFLSSTVGTRSVCEELAGRLTNSNWPVITTSNKPSRLPRLLDMVTTIWQKRELYRVAQVDVYSGPAFFWAEIVCCALRRLGKPYVLILHGGNLPLFADRWPGRVRRLLQSAAAVVAPSRYLQEHLRPYRSVLHLLSNPLDLRAYEYNVRSQPRPRLIWLRAFESIYNPEMAPKVLCLLRESFPDISLIMVGPDKGDGSKQKMQALAERLEVGNRISLPGRVPKSDVPGWLNRADIFLNTTYIDNTPVSVMEAMACGLCIVSTNVGGIPYLLDQGRDALLVPPDDAEAMANAVRRILTEPGLAEWLSRNARRKAEQFDWGNVLPKWKELFIEAARRQRS